MPTKLKKNVYLKYSFALYERIRIFLVKRMSTATEDIPKQIFDAKVTSKSSKIGDRSNKIRDDTLGKKYRFNNVTQS